MHEDAAATFMLRDLSTELRLLFSIRQGDPLAMILFVIHIEPYLARLERELVAFLLARPRLLPRAMSMMSVPWGVTFRTLSGWTPSPLTLNWCPGPF